MWTKTWEQIFGKNLNKLAAEDLLKIRIDVLDFTGSNSVDLKWLKTKKTIHNAVKNHLEKRKINETEVILMRTGKTSILYSKKRW